MFRVVLALFQVDYAPVAAFCHIRLLFSVFAPFFVCLSGGCV